LASGRTVGSRNTDPTHGGGHIILVELRPPKKLLLGWPEPGLPLAGSALLQYDPTFGAASFSCLPAQNAARSGWFSRSAESRQPHGANPAASVARSVDLNAQHRVDIPRHRVDFAHRQPRNPPDRHSRGMSGEDSTPDRVDVPGIRPVRRGERGDFHRITAYFDGAALAEVAVTATAACSEDVVADRQAQAVALPGDRVEEHGRVHRICLRNLRLARGRLEFMLLAGRHRE